MMAWSMKEAFLNMQYSFDSIWKIFEARIELSYEYG